jgi:hypothetical protein
MPSRSTIFILQWTLTLSSFSIEIRILELCLDMKVWRWVWRDALGSVKDQPAASYVDARRYLLPRQDCSSKVRGTFS